MLESEFDIDVDVCTTQDNPLGARNFYTKEDNGLESSWTSWAFCNPPYNEIKLWVDKAMHERWHHGVKSILLLPARTDTKWFHEYIWDNQLHEPRPNIEIRFLKGRLRFGDSKNSAPFPSMLVIYK